MEGEIEVEAESVVVQVGRLEIRPLEGGAMPWAVQVMLDGEPVPQVMGIDLRIRFGEAPTATIEHRLDRPPELQARASGGRLHARATGAPLHVTRSAKDAE